MSRQSPVRSDPAQPSAAGRLPMPTDYRVASGHSPSTARLPLCVTYHPPPSFSTEHSASCTQHRARTNRIHRSPSTRHPLPYIRPRRASHHPRFFSQRFSDWQRCRQQAAERGGESAGAVPRFPERRGRTEDHFRWLPQIGTGGLGVERNMRVDGDSARIRQVTDGGRASRGRGGCWLAWCFVIWSIATSAFQITRATSQITNGS